MFQQLLKEKVAEKGQLNINIGITGTVFIALALIAVLGIATGIAINEIQSSLSNLSGSGNQSGLGNALIWIGAISFITLIILAILCVVFRQQSEPY
jgi:hypothetical protein